MEEPFLHITKEQERSITLFYHYLRFREINVTSDDLDGFYSWVFEKREEKKLLNDLVGLEL